MDCINTGGDLLLLKLAASLVLIFVYCPLATQLTFIAKKDG